MSHRMILKMGDNDKDRASYHHAKNKTMVTIMRFKVIEDSTFWFYGPRQRGFQRP